MEGKMNVPELRFKEFKDSWIIRRVGDFAKYYDGTHQTPKYVESGIPFYSVEHITANQFTKTKYISEAVFEKENKRVKLERGDILMTRIGSIGKSKYIDWDVEASFYVSLALIKQNENYDSAFLNQYINSNSFQKELWERTIHVAFPQKINLGEIGKCAVQFPTLAEQQKIASFLTAVDNKLQQLKKKKELLEQYKKGVMQQIFSQELRFTKEDGSSYLEWEEKKLGDMIEVTIDNRGKTPPTSKSGVPLIEVNAINGRQVDYDKINKYVSQEVFQSWFRKHLADGDILFSTVGKTAMCSIYFDSTIAGIAQNIVGLRFNKENSILMYYLLSYGPNNHKFKRIEMGAVQPSVKVSQMIHIKFQIPSLEEQTKIANFLSGIDDKIEKVAHQISHTETWKKGLLQKMFV